MQMLPQHHGMILSVIHGFLALIISIAIMPTFLGAFTKDENVIKLGLEYSRIVFLFAPVIMISLAFEKIFQAVGRMNETMFALLCGCISNIILDPLLIFGIGFFPKLGIKGAALATGIGQIITVIVYLIYYVKKPLPVKLKKSCLPLQRSLDFRLYTIGVPAILNLALPSFLVSFLNGVLSAYSDIYVVVLGIYYKLQTFLYLPASGIVQGNASRHWLQLWCRRNGSRKKNFPSGAAYVWWNHDRRNTSVSVFCK